MPTSQDAIVNALMKVPGPDGRTPLPRSGALGGVVVKDGRVYISIEVEPAQAAGAEPLRAEVERAVAALEGVSSVLVTLTAQKLPGSSPQAAPARAPRPCASAGSQGAGGARQSRRARGQDHHRGRVRQGRRRQVHHGLQPGPGAAQPRA